MVKGHYQKPQQQKLLIFYQITNQSCRPRLEAQTGNHNVLEAETLDCRCWTNEPSFERRTSLDVPPECSGTSTETLDCSFWTDEPSSEGIISLDVLPECSRTSTETFDCSFWTNKQSSEGITSLDVPPDGLEALALLKASGWKSSTKCCWWEFTGNLGLFSIY